MNRKKNLLAALLAGLLSLGAVACEVEDDPAGDPLQDDPAEEPMEDETLDEETLDDEDTEG